MKKLICVTLCVLFACISLVGCSSAIIPTSTPSWAEGEVLTYNVRKATSYELTTVGVDLDYRQILPSYVTGTYSTKITSASEDDYLLETVLSTTETYTLSDFGVDTAFFDQVKTLAESVSDDAVYFDGNNIKVDVTVESTCQFNKTSFLPTSSSKTIKSAVFLHSSTVNGKTYDAQYEINDIYCSTTYDYSAKTPKVSVNSNIADETTHKLKKTTTTKTYDNEQLLFLLRSFSLANLKSNLTTAITLFDALAETKPLSVSANVGSNPTFNYMIGGSWSGMQNNNFTYYQNETGEYTDKDGNIVTVTERAVSLISLSTGGVPILYYFDNLNSDSLTFKNALIRMQYGYIVCDIDAESLATL